MNYQKAIIYVLAFQSIVLGFAAGNAFWHPSLITIGGLVFMVGLLPFTIHNVFRSVVA